ncbi:MAG: hypothetical protein ACI89X_000585 [Planctomycetota bacterium]|jgi:hypothetical protein
MTGFVCCHMTQLHSPSMVFPPMSTAELRELLGPAAEQADEILATLRTDRSRLPVAFPGIPRRFGKAVVGGGKRAFGEATVDLDAFRTCDLVAAYLVTSLEATEEEVIDVFAHGDIEERAMLFRSLNFMPLDSTTSRLFGEALRTNIVLHLEAAMCDSDLLARSIKSGAIDADTANRLLLKFAFIGMDLTRALDIESHANATLSTMLQDLATEREAAGRSVWQHTYRMLGHAVCPGALGRLIGGLEHGDDGVRHAAADGLLAMRNNDSSLQPLLAQFAQERLPREPRETVRELLQQLATN